jgi:death on curing protein
VPFTWVDKAIVLAVDDEQLAEHGGPSGLRDEARLDSALARPQNLLAYGDPDIAALAAAYAFGIARGHAFVDGNKRTSLVVTELFLALNGHELGADDADCVAVWLEIAAGTVSEEQFAGWLRERIVPIQAGG